MKLNILSVVWKENSELETQNVPWWLPWLMPQYFMKRKKVYHSIYTSNFYTQNDYKLVKNGVKRSLLAVWKRVPISSKLSTGKDKSVSFGSRIKLVLVNSLRMIWLSLLFLIRA